MLSVPLSAVTTRNPNAKVVTEGQTSGANAVATTNASAKDETKEVVFIDEGGKAKMVVVKTGISDYDNIEVLEGLKEGDVVVSGPFLVVSKTIKEGDLIEKTAAKNFGATSNN